MAIASIWRGGPMRQFSGCAQPGQPGPQRRLGRGQAVAVLHRHLQHQQHGQRNDRGTAAARARADGARRPGAAPCARTSGLMQLRLGLEFGVGARTNGPVSPSSPASCRRSSNGRSSGCSRSACASASICAESGASEGRLSSISLLSDEPKASLSRPRRVRPAGVGARSTRGRAHSGRRAGPWSAAASLAGGRVASNTSEQWPQRTQPSEIFSWSGTTLNIVPQAGQRVIRLMSEEL